MDMLEYLRKKRMGMMDQPNPFNTLPARPGMNYGGAINTMPARPGTNYGDSITPIGINSINPPWGVNPRGVGDDITIPPARRVNTPGVFNPATGQNRVARQGPIWPAGLMREEMEDSFLPMGGYGDDSVTVMWEAGYPESDQPGTKEYQEIAEFEARDDGIVEPPKESMEYAKKMHSIQEAMLGGADFGYEDFWPQRLGVTNDMIDMVMLTPIEAMVFAMQNPTDMVLEEFERKYGWPINVNSEALREYVDYMGKYIKEYN